MREARYEKLKILNQNTLMTAPQLHRQLYEQLRQWIVPEDRRHLQGYAEILGAILLSQSGCLSHWLPYLGHRDCQARSHLERLSYFIHNRAITAETFYAPIIRHLLQAWSGEAMTLVIDTSMLWDEYCLIEVTLAWGGRSIVLAQTVLKHGSASVAFEDYRPVLTMAQALLPNDVRVTLLADRGFEHGELIRWLRRQGWHWAIRAQCDLQISLANGQQHSVAQLFPDPGQAHLFHQVRVMGDIDCHLATAHWPDAKEPWAVLTDLAPSLQTFALYGQRFGGIELHFKDYKSAAFDVLRSRIRDPQALTCLMMLLAMAQLLAIHLGFFLVHLGQRSRLDWHAQRGLSFLQLGLRELQRLCYQHLAIPAFLPFPYCNPPPASASRRKRAALDSQIEFSRVTVFFS